MSDIKLDLTELGLFAEVGSRGDHFREAVRDRAADQVNETGQRSEITTMAGHMVDVVMAPVTASIGTTATDAVKPSDLASVAGGAPGVVPAPEPGEPAKEGSV